MSRVTSYCPAAPSIAACEPGRRRADEREVRRLVLAEEERGQEEARHQQEHREHERQDVAAAAAALEDLAHRHQPDRAEPPHRAASSADGCGAVTASMNSSDRRGGSNENRRTSPAGRPPRAAPARSACSSTSSFTQSPSRSMTDAPAEALDPRAAVAGDLHLEVAPPGRGLQRVDLAVGDHAPAADDHDVLADLLDKVELVRAEHDADARRGALAQDLGHRLDAERVEARERLVEDEQLRVVDQRRRELDPLLVAVGQVLELRLRAVGEPEPLEPDGRARPRVAAATARGAGRSTPAARRRASAGRARAARACTRTAAACPRRRASRPSDTSPASGTREPEDAAHRRRLAGAVGPEEAEQPATARRQRRTVERRDAPVVLGQAPDLEHRRATISDPVERATTPPGVPDGVAGCAWISGVA